MPKFKHHLFICTNERPPDNPKGSCAAKGGEAYLDQFRQEIRRLGLKQSIRANKAGCLDSCEQGPCVVVYPEGVWYRIEKPEDVVEISERHLLGGHPVERLRLKD